MPRWQGANLARCKPYGTANKKLIQVHASGWGGGQNCSPMKYLIRLAIVCLLSHDLPALAALPLQPWFDAALPGARIRLPPGTYQGPAVITKPLTLEGVRKKVDTILGRGGAAPLVQLSLMK